MGDEQKAALDMENRDPNGINDHIKVSFEDIIGEPEATRSCDCVWKCAFCCFNCTLKSCYQCLSCLCACPLACLWGCQFACLACNHVWCMTPYLRYMAIEFTVIRKIYVMFCDTFYGPMYETMGLCFSRIKVQQA